MEVAKNVFQKDQDLKYSLIVRGLGFTSQLFSIAFIPFCFATKIIKENNKSH